MTALPLPGPIHEDCQCGCGLYGVRRQKTMNDGLQHVKGCPCNRCRGSRVKRTSGNRERRIARRLGGHRSPLSGAISGYDIRTYLRGGIPLYLEETVAVVFWKWWHNKTTQQKVARLMALPDGLRAFRGPDVTVMPNVDFDALVALAQDTGP